MSQPLAKRRRVELTLEDKIKLMKESTAQPKPKSDLGLFREIVNFKN